MSKYIHELWGTTCRWVKYSEKSLNNFLLCMYDSITLFICALFTITCIIFKLFGFLSRDNRIIFLFAFIDTPNVPPQPSEKHFYIFYLSIYLFIYWHLFLIMQIHIKTSACIFLHLLLRAWWSSCSMQSSLQGKIKSYWNELNLGVSVTCYTESADPYLNFILN